MVAFLDGADTQSFAIAAPVIASELSIESTQLGMIFSTGALGIAMGAIVCGPIADRTGPKRMLALCTLCFGIFQFATSFANSFVPLLLLRILAGVGLGGAAPCFLALAAAHASAERRAALLSFLWAFFPLGALIGGIVNGWIVVHFGWRTVFLIGGILPIVLAALLTVLVADTPSPASPSPSAAQLTGRKQAPVWWRERVLRSRILLLWCVFFAAFGSLAGVAVWMPTILVRSGFSPVYGGLVLSWNAVGALISMGAAGYLIERFGPQLLTISLLGGAVLLAATAFAIPSFAWVATGMVLLGIMFGLAGSGSIAAVGALLPSDDRSSGLGWSMGMGRLGQVILPLLMGIILQRFGPVATLVGLSVVPAALAFAAWRFANSVR